MASSGMRRLEGQVAIITGASNGIGAATTRKFVAEGAYVYIADIDEEAGAKLCEDLHGGATFVKCNVAVVGLAVEEKGRLDIMLNNAGKMRLRGNALRRVQLETWERVMAVNVTGSMLGMKHAASVMIPRGRGCILFNCSVYGNVKTDGAPYDYVVSKHAVLGLLKSGAVELGKVGIRVNAVSAYAIATKMIEECFDEVSNGMYPKEAIDSDFAKNATFKGKTLTVEDVANAFVFLASDEAGYINGHNLVVDGGYSVHGRDIADFRGAPSST